MGEWEIECFDCGWRGLVAEPVEETDDSGGRSPASFLESATETAFDTVLDDL